MKFQISLKFLVYLRDYQLLMASYQTPLTGWPHDCQQFPRSHHPTHISQYWSLVHSHRNATEHELQRALLVQTWEMNCCASDTRLYPATQAQTQVNEKKISCRNPRDILGWPTIELHGPADISPALHTACLGFISQPYD
jgi:hypothetical protein